MSPGTAVSSGDGTALNNRKSDTPSERPSRPRVPHIGSRGTFGRLYSLLIVTPCVHRARCLEICRSSASSPTALFSDFSTLALCPSVCMHSDRRDRLLISRSVTHPLFGNNSGCDPTYLQLCSPTALPVASQF